MHVKIGNHFHFVRKGATISTGVFASSTVPGVCGFAEDDTPAIDDALAAYWKEVPCVEMASIVTAEAAAEEVYCPAAGSGKYVLEEVVSGRVKQTIEIQGQALDALAAEIIYGHSGAALADGQRIIAPALNASIQGWLLLDQYAQDDKWMARLRLWGRLTIANATEFKDAVVKPKYTFTTLHSTYNKGAFAEAGLIA